MAARRILQNKWDNWYGYEGRYRTKEFGLDGAAAGHWLLTGDASFNAAYASDETLRAAKIAAGLPVSAEGKQGLFELNKRIRDAEAQRDELLAAQLKRRAQLIQQRNDKARARDLAARR